MKAPSDSDRSERERHGREEVEELTEMLRSDESWSDLREQLAAQGANPSSLLLAAFMESEDCEQFGAVVTPGRRVDVRTSDNMDYGNCGPGRTSLLAH